MKYRQFGVTTVLLVIFLSVWFAVSIVTAWSAPVGYPVQQKSLGFCEWLKDVVRDVEYKEEFGVMGAMNYVYSAQKPDGMSQEDAARSREVWLGVELMKLRFEAQKWREAYLQDCGIQ